MLQNISNSIITTASGVLGGVGKAITGKQVMLDISLQSVCKVALYAENTVNVCDFNFGLMNY
ncbi:MAG: hypothetical protein ABIJ97_05900 [Bacteroidota bacterium]